MKTILFLTDFYYQAKGREYYKEDIELTDYLRKYFRICISHIHDCERMLPHLKNIFLRNTGPQAGHQDQLLKIMNLPHTNHYNDLQGKGDIQGKSHLLELFQLKYPVIPTVDGIKDIALLGDVEKFLLKPLYGADSQGVQIVDSKNIHNIKTVNYIIQPMIDFEYEVSFYFVNNEFHYSLYNSDTSKRWELSTYTPSPEDLHFAKQFITWNTCKHGIQRVDACRTSTGDLLLMELEDYNPYLSLEILGKNVKERFLQHIVESFSEIID